MKILVVSAHPDDEVLGPGGSILKRAASGDDVTILLACCGTNLRYGKDEADRLRATTGKVAGMLGAKKILYGELPDQGLDLMSLPEIARVIEQTIADVDPEMIWTHYWGDINRDHRALSEAVMVAARPYAAPGVKAIHCFETPSSTEWGPPAGLQPFHPQRFVDISAVLDRKLDAFAQYTSEVRPWPHPRSREALEARARTWGSVSGVKAAEAFVVARETC
ncbi:MAG TPA: PIG-L deacetylase family protein [Patescibacteria group bacterium]|nr:PIG-L deacetylase family protein [Patescibacteria group bacterium]